LYITHYKSRDKIDVSAFDNIVCLNSHARLRR
jgi:hypothetical protein